MKSLISFKKYNYDIIIFYNVETKHNFLKYFMNFLKNNFTFYNFLFKNKKSITYLKKVKHFQNY